VSRLQLKSDYFKKYCALTNGKEKVMFWIAWHVTMYSAALICSDELNG
jgi:hypothetical protein